MDERFKNEQLNLNQTHDDIFNIYINIAQLGNNTYYKNLFNQINYKNLFEDKTYGLDDFVQYCDNLLINPPEYPIIQKIDIRTLCKTPEASLING